MEKFFAEQAQRSGNSKSKDVPQSEDVESGTAAPAKKYPKGVVLGKDGKPCRSCTSVADWAALAKRSTARPKTSAPSQTTSTAFAPPPLDCPPDVDTLGNHTWTLLHSISASYPPTASPIQQSEMKQFLTLFSKLYPCWVCAEDFQQWMSRKENEPRLEGRAGFGRWMCDAHNEVNRKLGKTEFDCSKWEERWRTGWKDGRCD